MFVYFIRALDTPLVKIGHSANPTERLKKLQTGSPYRLELMGVVPCRSLKHSQYVEARAHEYFKKNRRGGEWFKMGKPEKAFIKSLIEKG